MSSRPLYAQNLVIAFSIFICDNSLNVIITPTRDSRLIADWKNGPRKMKNSCLTIGYLLFVSMTSSAQSVPPTKIPLCTGLSIVTAISQQDGDYESIKTIESVTDKAVRLKYSSERMYQDPLVDDKPSLQKTMVYRLMSIDDLAKANLYEQIFYEKLPELIPGTTAIGTSAAILNDLKKNGEAEIGIFIPFSGKASIDREEHPNVYDNQMIAKIKRVEPGTVMLPVIVNNQRVELPTIHAMGDFFGDKTEFFFLDDPANPIALKWRYGIDALAEIAAEIKKNSGVTVSSDRDRLQVTKITYRCGDASVPAASGPPDGSQLEKALASTGKADIYDIYFTFNSDQLRDESEPRLKEIAAALQKHPDWKLGVAGHTDSIGGSAYNLDLSKRRASAVKDALVKRYKIDPSRLTTTGYGASQPKDTNDTLDGRARNRRVELVKQ